MTKIVRLVKLLLLPYYLHAGCTYLGFINTCICVQVNEELVKDVVENEWESEDATVEEDIDDVHFSIGSSKFEMKLDTNTVSKLTFCNQIFTRFVND